MAQPVPPAPRPDPARPIAGTPKPTSPNNFLFSTRKPVYLEFSHKNVEAIMEEINKAVAALFRMQAHSVGKLKRKRDEDSPTKLKNHAIGRKSTE
jgi:hypothetical protein